MEVFRKEGITLPDVLEMPEEEMKRLGIEFYGMRRRLMTAVKDHQRPSYQAPASSSAPEAAVANSIQIGSQAPVAPQQRQAEEVQGAGPTPPVLAMQQLWEDRSLQGPSTDMAHEERHRPAESRNKTVATNQKGEALHFTYLLTPSPPSANAHKPGPSS